MWPYVHFVLLCCVHHTNKLMCLVIVFLSTYQLRSANIRILLNLLKKGVCVLLSFLGLGVFYDACIVVVGILSPRSMIVLIVFFSPISIIVHHVCSTVLSFIGTRLWFNFNASFLVHLLPFPLFLIINNWTKSLHYRLLFFAIVVYKSEIP